MYRNDDHNTKFTRGEKCIFFHIVLVFIAILILLIIFIIHLYVVKHTEKSTGNTRRSGQDNAHHLLIGVVYLDISPVVTVCNTLLLHTKWSICPANCVVTRTHPELAFILMSWRIDYGKDTIYTTNIERSVPHPHFDRDTYSNNIGLFEHVDSIPMQHVFNLVYNGNWELSGFNLSIISREKNEDTDAILAHDATYMTRETCMRDISFIGDLRSYEYCIAPVERTSLVYGALVILNEKVVGIYSWGERKVNQLPCVVLNITFYRDWITTIIYDKNTQ